LSGDTVRRNVGNTKGKDGGECKDRDRGYSVDKMRKKNGTEYAVYKGT
jgi:hypothetical protein